MIDALDLLAFSVSTALMFIGLGTVTAAAVWAVKR